MFLDGCDLAFGSAAHEPGDVGPVSGYAGGERRMRRPDAGDDEPGDLFINLHKIRLFGAELSFAQASSEKPSGWKYHRHHTQKGMKMDAASRAGLSCLSISRRFPFDFAPMTQCRTYGARILFGIDFPALPGWADVWQSAPSTSSGQALRASHP
jgi:hypothetical protein